MKIQGEEDQICKKNILTKPSLVFCKHFLKRAQNLVLGRSTVYFFPLRLSIQFEEIFLKQVFHYMYLCTQFSNDYFQNLQASNIGRFFQLASYHDLDWIHEEFLKNQMLTTTSTFLFQFSNIFTILLRLLLLQTLTCSTKLP